MTPVQALATVRTQLNETTAAFWTDAEIMAYLWEGETILAGKIGGIQAATAHTTVTGTAAYAKPTNCLRIDRLTYNGKKLKKGDFRDRDSLDGTTYGSTLQSARPEMYVEWGVSVYLYPVPDDAKPLDYFFFKSPTVLTATASAFSLQEETLQAMLPDYAIWKGSMKDQELTRADRHKKYWDDNLLRAESIWNDRNNQDRVLGVKDEDEYAGGPLGMD